MRQTAKRLLFFIFILSFSLLLPNAQAKNTDSLESFFQTPAYQEAFLLNLVFQVIGISNWMAISTKILIPISIRRF